MKLKYLAIAAGFIALPAIAGAQETSRGPECPKGCPTSRGAAGLNGIQFLALQQELRDRGCGNARVPGVLDAATRRAIRVCAQRLGVANNARAVLTAMNIGFGEGDYTPMAGGNDAPNLGSGRGGSLQTQTTTTTTPTTESTTTTTTTTPTTTTPVPTDTTMKKDSVKKDSTSIR